MSFYISAVNTLGCMHYTMMLLAETCNTRNQHVLCCAKLERHVLHGRHVRWQAGHCSIQRSLHRFRHQRTHVVCSASQSPLGVPKSTWLRSFVEWLHANGVTGLIQPEAKLALYEAEPNAGLTERGIVFTQVCQPKVALYRMLCIWVVPQR